MFINLLAAADVESLRIKAKKARQRAATARWRVNHPDAAIANVRKWQQKNPELVRQYAATSRSRMNKDKVRQYNTDYREANRETLRQNNRRWAATLSGKRTKVLNQARRRARKAGAAGTCSAEQLQARIDFYGGCCYVCLLEGKHTPYEAIDHVIPLAKGGSNWPSNLRPICTYHNSVKRAMAPTKFLKKAA